MSDAKSFLVRAMWDEEAKVWVATSDDVPGLATESPTLDQLVPKLQVMIPELLDANGYADGNDLHFNIVGQIMHVPVRETA